MKTAKVFKHGNSQAVRLPKEFRFSSEEVQIKRVGVGVLLLATHATYEQIMAVIGRSGRVSIGSSPRIRSGRGNDLGVRYGVPGSNYSIGSRRLLCGLSRESLLSA